MFNDICSYLESCLHYIEIAGVLHNESKHIEKIEDTKLLLVNLSTLSNVLKNKLICSEIERFSIVVTFNSHTISFLYDHKTGVWLFDSLEATLKLVDSDFDLNHFLKKSFEANVEYSGVILFHEYYDHWFRNFFNGNKD